MAGLKGRGGRPPKPTSLKILDGLRSHTPLPANEPKPEIGMPDCPAGFSEAQRKAFAEFGASLLACGVLTKLDGPALTLLAMDYDRVMQSAEHVGKFGPAWINMTGCYQDGKVVALPECKVNPHLKIQHEWQIRLETMLREFGMTPSSRTKVSTVPTSTDDFDEFLKHA